MFIGPWPNLVNVCRNPRWRRGPDSLPFGFQERFQRCEEYVEWLEEKQYSDWISDDNQHERRSPIFEIARVLVRFDQVASFIVNANDGVMRTTLKLCVAELRS